LMKEAATLTWKTECRSVGARRLSSSTQRSPWRERSSARSRTWGWTSGPRRWCSSRRCQTAACSLTSGRWGTERLSTSGSNLSVRESQQQKYFIILFIHFIYFIHWLLLNTYVNAHMGIYGSETLLLYTKSWHSWYYFAHSRRWHFVVLNKQRVGTLIIIVVQIILMSLVTLKYLWHMLSRHCKWFR
jgi:hypothetical protein